MYRKTPQGRSREILRLLEYSQRDPTLLDSPVLDELLDEKTVALVAEYILGRCELASFLRQHVIAAKLPLAWQQAARDAAVLDCQGTLFATTDFPPV